MHEEYNIIYLNEISCLRWSVGSIGFAGQRRKAQFIFFLSIFILIRGSSQLCITFSLSAVRAGMLYVCLINFSLLLTEEATWASGRSRKSFELQFSDERGVFFLTSTTIHTQLEPEYHCTALEASNNQISYTPVRLSYLPCTEHYYSTLQIKVW